jgi:glycosyltransferase involved in cell wall biosynthesis
MSEIDKQLQPLVAIAVPVYNTEKYFRECLEHIVGQTYQNWICYITDNASTDSSHQIALEFEAKDSRFKVFRNEKTVSAFENWNITLGRMAQLPAKYIKYECADDWMFPECIERMVELHQKDEQIGAVYGYRLDDKIVDCDGLDINEGQIFDGKKILRRSMTLNITGGLGQALYRMEVLKQISPNLHVINENNIHCDVELNDNVMIRSKVGFVYQVLTYYRRHNGQVLSFALKANTVLFGNERRMFLHLNVFPDILELYQQHRLEYALFLLKCKRKKYTDILEWHKKYLERPITKAEFKLAKQIEKKRIMHEIRIKFIQLLHYTFN